MSLCLKTGLSIPSCRKSWHARGVGDEGPEKSKSTSSTKVEFVDTSDMVYCGD